MRADLRLVDGEKKRLWENAGGGLAKYLPTGVYYVRKSFRRDRLPNLFRSTGETTIGRARAKAQVLIEAHRAYYMRGEQTPGVRIGKGKKVSDVIEEILRTETVQKRQGTQDNHRLYLGELQKEWGNFEVSRITKPLWEDWLNGFRTRKVRGTFWDYAKHMNMVLMYAYKNKYMSHPVKLSNPDPKKETGMVLSVPQIKLLFDVMNDTTRDQLVLSYECCMRLREVLYLTWDRVDLEAGVITLRPEDVKTGSKTGKGREVPLSDRALERLRRRLVESDGSRYVFPSPNDPTKPVDANATAWKKAKAEARARDSSFPIKARWHDLRHSSLTHMLLDKQIDPVKVSLFAGVSVQTIQRVYLHSTADKVRPVSKALRIF